MSLLRSDLQVALRDLHLALQESVDHYRDAAEFVHQQSAAAAFSAIAQQREQLADTFAQAIRAADDLPSVPDPELESGEQFINHLTNLFAADEIDGLREQRLESEQRLEALLHSPDCAALREQQPALQAKCEADIKRARERLQAL